MYIKTCDFLLSKMQCVLLCQYLLQNYEYKRFLKINMKN